jgi:DNA-binding CsgD family transcriptional regulator
MWPTLWVVSDNVRQVTPPASSTPVVLLSLKADFTDDEVRHAGVAAYAGPGSTRKDVVRCLVAAGRGRWVALRRHLPEPLRRLTPHQRVLARWLLAGEAEDAIAQGIGLDVGFVRQELLSLQALLGATSRRGLIRLLAPRPRHEEHTRPPHGPSDGW